MTTLDELEEEDEENLSVDIEEEFVDSDEEAEEAETAAAGDEDDDVVLASPVAAGDADAAADALAGTLEKATLEETSEDAPLARLLRECGQSERDVLPMREATRGWTKDGVRKIGEGTYGEAFKGDGVVLKIVPMGGERLVNGEPQMGPGQIRAEAVVAKRLAQLRPREDAPLEKNATEGFIDTLSVSVCRGPYAPQLLEAWTEYDEKKKSENENPAGFDDDQLYVVFACADGGVDLEHVHLNSAAEARSTLMQITIALAVAEEACAFEHRDLHWGNVLLRRCGVEETRVARLNEVNVEYPTNGLEVSIIDFTLSRLDVGGGGSKKADVAFCDLEADPELFRGQRDTARARRAAGCERRPRVGGSAAAPRRMRSGCTISRTVCSRTRGTRRPTRKSRKSKRSRSARWDTPARQKRSGTNSSSEVQDGDEQGVAALPARAAGGTGREDSTGFYRVCGCIREGDEDDEDEKRWTRIVHGVCIISTFLRESVQEDARLVAVWSGSTPRRVYSVATPVVQHPRPRPPTLV